MGKEEDRRPLQEHCRFEEPDDADEWVSAAWNERRDERTSWAELGRKYDRDWRTVRTNVGKYSRLVADAYRRGDVDALAVYLEGLHDDKKAQLEASSKAQTVFVTKEGEVVAEPDWRTRVAARKEVTNIRKLMADACGVVTERKGVEHSGKIGLDTDNIHRWSEEKSRRVLEAVEAPDGSESGD